MAGPDNNVKLTGRPEEVVPLKARTLVMTWPGIGPKVMAWLFLTWNVLVSGGAGSQSAFPTWVAARETTPGPVKVSVFPPVMTPGPAATLKVTGSPEEAAALKLTESVVAWLPRAGKLVMAWVRKGCGAVNAHASTSWLLAPAPVPAVNPAKTCGVPRSVARLRLVAERVGASGRAGVGESRSANQPLEPL